MLITFVHDDEDRAVGVSVPFGQWGPYNIEGQTGLRNTGFVLQIVGVDAHVVCFFSGSDPAAKGAACIMHCDLQQKWARGNPKHPKRIFAHTWGATRNSAIMILVS